MDLIDREQAIETIREQLDPSNERTLDGVCYNDGLDMAITLVSKLPSAEKTGKWLHERLLSTTGGTYPVTRCSVCQNTMPFEWETPYCPNCGARMVE